jgi:hypothetical protein
MVYAQAISAVSDIVVELDGFWQPNLSSLVLWKFEEMVMLLAKCVSLACS